MEILNNILIIGLVAFAIVMLYCLRSHGTSFDLTCWLKTNVWRFIVGGILIIALSVLLETSAETETLLQVLGFATDKSNIALGAGIGALLIAGVNGNSSKILENKH